MLTCIPKFTFATSVASASLECTAKLGANGASINVTRIKALKEAGMIPAVIARELKVARSLVYRRLPQPQTPLT